ncbi:ABC transporter substrate-binding protein [Frankia sp. CcI49]|uniref:transporter substrate-binding domain-containing protein n=1 Tax=unclassified Frankia TaxID=2632575 RepID=UPI0006C9F237|nr:MULTISPECIES: transporter substrate-binding domain-containing protein [unclassified Frankia]KPM52376.1 ABC transporter substrate-binding protein [Frankia sp. R43]ONH59922.1 ABC transporter substrate-binding protein [Frankia sp. CcI49]
MSALVVVVAAAVLGACGTTGARFPAAIEPRPAATTTRTADITVTGTGTGTGSGGSGAAKPCADGHPVRWSPAPPASMPSPGAFRPGSIMDDIWRKGDLTVAIVTDAPPAGSMNWTEPTLEGFDVDIAGAIATALFGSGGKSKIRFRAVTTKDRAGLLADPNSGVDIVVATYTITCERKEKENILFSGVYFESRFALLVPAKAGFTTLRDFAGYTVCSTEGATSVQKLEDAARSALAPGDPPLTITLRPRAADCLVAVQQGEADGVATDDIILAGMKARDQYVDLPPGGVTAAGDDLAEPYGVALHRSHLDDRNANKLRDEEFVRFVNGVLRDMMTSGAWTASYQTWLKPTEEIVTPLAQNPAWPEG